MSALPQSVLRWARYQSELGLDEVVLDMPLTLAPPPAASPGARVMPNPREMGSRSANATSSNAPPPRPSARVVVPAASVQAAKPVVSSAPVRTAIPTFADVRELSAHAQACTRCVLHGRRRSVLATGGPEQSTWAVLTLYAWGEDAERGGVLEGDYARPLLDLAHGLGLPDPAVAAIFACTPDDPSDITIQGFTEAVRCRGHWMQRLKLSGARAVLVLDHKATSLARGPSTNVDWPSFRGRRWELDGIPAVSTHHPSRLARQDSLRPEVESDLQQILSIIGAL